VTQPGLRRAIGLLALVGLGLAAYLHYVRATGGTIACTSGGCETVQASRYAELLGVPVAALGAAAYAGILASAFRADDLALVGGATLALVGVCFGAYLLYVQLAVIGAVCEWCVASDAVMSVLARLTVLRLACGFSATPPGSTRRNSAAMPRWRPARPPTD
jgi:uncharacterized membrane protein